MTHVGRRRARVGFPGFSWRCLSTSCYSWVSSHSPLRGLRTQLVGTADPCAASACGIMAAVGTRQRDVAARRQNVGG
jgi:hypothetical protein